MSYKNRMKAIRQSKRNGGYYSRPTSGFRQTKSRHVCVHCGRLDARIPTAFGWAHVECKA